MNKEVRKAVNILREKEEAWLSKELARSISSLAYPVGMGIAPKSHHLKNAARTLFERYARMIEMARAAGQKEARTFKRKEKI